MIFFNKNEIMMFKKKVKQECNRKYLLSLYKNLFKTDNIYYNIKYIFYIYETYYDYTPDYYYIFSTILDYMIISDISINIFKQIFEIIYWYCIYKNKIDYFHKVLYNKIDKFYITYTPIFTNILVYKIFIISDNKNINMYLNNKNKQFYLDLNKYTKRFSNTKKIFIILILFYNL